MAASRRRRRRQAGAGTLETKVVPVVAAASLAAGIGRGLVDRRRRDGDGHGDTGGDPANDMVADTDGDNGDSADTDGDNGDSADTDGDNGDSADTDDDDDATFLDKVATRLPFLRVPVRVQKRFGELHGNNMASAVTLQSFLSLFPLLLVGIAIVGFFSAHSSTDVPGRIVRNLGLTGDAAKSVRDALRTARKSRRAASVVGLAGLGWSGLGLVAALQYGYNQVWQVESRGLKDKAVGVVWLVGAALIFVALAAASTILRWLPGVVAPLAVVLTFAATFGLWLWTAKLLPNRDVGWRALVPGALSAPSGSRC